VHGVDYETAITTVGHAIQLSVAPVFLLSGIGAMLAVMTNRLARVVDRARSVEAQLAATATENAEPILDDLRSLSKRAKFINLAITFCTITALFVCAVVATLFLGAFLRFDASVPIAILFVGAMVTFFFGLLCFLREIFVATATLRIGPR
jgi:hypothetical protein